LAPVEDRTEAWARRRLPATSCAPHPFNRTTLRTGSPRMNPVTTRTDPQHGSQAEAAKLAPFAPLAQLQGALYITLAFDWGDEVDLDHAQRLLHASPEILPRRSRTPSSIEYRPAPLLAPAAPVSLHLAELGDVAADARIAVFDFGGVTVGLTVPFDLSAESLRRLAGSLAEPEVVVAAVRAALGGVFERLRPAIRQPLWSPLGEEFFVFQFAPGEALGVPAALLETQAPWLAALVRLEDVALSPTEVAEATRLHLGYGADDLFVADWSAAVLIDRDCEETLRTIEYANLQLLEFRHIDGRLDDRLKDAYRLIHPASRARLPQWRSQARGLRALGELRIDANDVFERTGNVLKLVGDPYLARVYRMLAARFHLDEWESSIERSLETAEGVYQVVSDQAAHYRAELLELIIILLIMFEIVMSFLGR
jgi:hypothetical protein